MMDQRQNGISILQRQLKVIIIFLGLGLLISLIMAIVRYVLGYTWSFSENAVI